MSDISAVVRNAVAWMPFAASFQIPFDVIDGAWACRCGKGDHIAGDMGCLPSDLYLASAHGAVVFGRRIGEVRC